MRRKPLEAVSSASRRGTYIVGAMLVLYAKVHLPSAGIEATVLKLASSVNVDVIQTNNFGSLTGTNSTGGGYNFSISALTIDGSKANNLTCGYGTRICENGFLLRDLRIRNCNHACLYSEWSNSSGSPGVDSMEAQVSNLKAHDSGTDNIEWLGPHDSQWVNVVSFGAGNIGFWIHGNGNGLLALNCHAYLSTLAWRLETTGVCLLNCIGEGSEAGAQQAQVVIGSNDCVAIGGAYYASSTGKVGSQIGETGVPVAGTHIQTKIINCTQGAINFVNDAGSSLVEAVVWNSGSPPLIGTPASTTRIRVLTNNNRGGSVTTPAVPASGTAATNTTGIDVTVFVTGGTVQSVSIGGVSTGLVSGTYRVPCGQTIAVTYSPNKPPTWTWLGGLDPISSCQTSAGRVVNVSESGHYACR